MMHGTIRALAFGPRLPPQGRSVAVELLAQRLVLHGDDGRDEEIAYAWLRPRGGGWNGDALTLEWDEGGATRAVSVHGEALRALRTAAPEALRERLGPHAQPRVRAPAVPLVIAGGALVAVAALVVVLFVTQGERLVDAAVARVPPEWEERLGQATLEAATATARPWPAGEATRVVDDLGARLAAQVQSPYTFRWVLLEGKQVNAMAAPGGYVIVFTGLVDQAETAEELAGVLAHEVQHVVLRHSLRGLVRGLGWRVILSILFGGAGDFGAPVAAWVEQLGSLRFSRGQESEADAAGVLLLQRAGIDPLGMATFFERLARSGGEPPAFLSTHPASEARAQAVRDALAGAAPSPPLPYDWAIVQADLQRRAPD
jgi:Zn-dependent protease with chaperone function